MSLGCGPLARHIYPSLVLVQPRNTRPCLTEKLLLGRKESNQTKKTKLYQQQYVKNFVFVVRAAKALARP